MQDVYQNNQNPRRDSNDLVPGRRRSSYSFGKHDSICCVTIELSHSRRRISRDMPSPRQCCLLHLRSLAMIPRYRAFLDNMGKVVTKSAVNEK